MGASCSAQTRKGTPCKAAPVRGTDRCLAHSDATTRESVGFVPDNGYAGRKPKPKPDEVARKLIEDNIVVVLRPHFRTLGYDVVDGEGGPRLEPLPGGGAKVYGTKQSTGEVVVSGYDDLGAQQGASDRLQDRVYGRPKQRTEHVGDGGGPVQIESSFDLRALTDEELALFERLAAKARSDAAD